VREPSLTLLSTSKQNPALFQGGIFYLSTYTGYTGNEQEIRNDRKQIRNNPDFPEEYQIRFEDPI
jgi:hypothetical protein